MAKAPHPPALLAGQPVSYWLERIMDKDSAVAQQARAVLGSTGRLTAAERATFAPDVPALLAALGGTGFNIPYYAAQCLNGLSAVELPALPAFFETLTNKGAFARPLADALLALAEQHPQVYVPIINQYLFDVFYGVPPLLHLADAVRSRGLEAAALGPHLAARLDSATDMEARAVATALGRLGVGVPALVKALRHRDAQTCQAAAASLGQIQDPTVIPALIEALAQQEYATVAAAAAALGQFGAAAASAVPGLQQALGSRSKAVRAAAKEALAAIPTGEAVPLPKVKVAARIAKPKADGAALLQTILDHPDDDAPRLVYADWLEEQGQQERAEFIRVQIELAATLPEYSARWRELTARQSELWQDHGDNWRKEAPAWAVKYGQYRRGFLGEIAVSAKDFIKGAAGLFARAPVQNLQVRNTDGLIAALFANPQLLHIRTLGIRVDAQTVAFVAQCPHLAKLSTLDLHSSPLHDEGMALLAASPYLRQLTTVYLNATGLTPAGAASLKRSPVLANVETLILGYNQRLGDAGITALACSPYLRKLTALRLWDCRIGLAGAQALASAPWFANLRLLDLNTNAIGAAGAAAIAQSPQATALRELHLGTANLGDDGARALAESPFLKDLTALHLHNNPIGAAGIISLAQSSQLMALNSLSLAYTEITDEAALALVNTSLPLRNLTCDYHRLSKKVQAAIRERFGH